MIDMLTEHNQRDPHDALRELCALSTTGTLSAEEQAELDAHLRSCGGCRELYAQYHALASEGMPFLAGNFADDAEALASNQWNSSRARERLLSTVDSIEEPEPVRSPGSRWLPQQKAVRLSPPRIGRHWLPRGNAKHWVKVAAAACILLFVGAASYWFGKRNEATAQSAYVAIVKQLRETSADKTSLDRALEEHVQKESLLQAESARRAQEIEQLRTDLQDLDVRSKAIATDATVKDDRLKDLAQQRDALADRLQKLEQAFQDSQSQIAQLRTVSQDRDTLASRLRITEARYQTAQTELGKLADQLNKDGDPVLKAQVRELSARVDEQQQQLKRSDQFLASDRDIRELMGARQLYIADVFDVGGDGRTRKPYGRVFYTQGKSLIFYAFDLDRQPALKTAAAYQVWGQKEAAQGESVRPLNLGILYMDSESNRRWVLRSDDPKQLAEIDAVFVTVEPGGGSRKPTGKPFLYALLRKEANHP